MTKKFEFLRTLSGLLTAYDMNISSKTKSYCQAAIRETLVECLKEIGGEEEPREQVIVESQEPPKKRTRKKKEPEVVVSAEDTPDGAAWVKYDTEEQVVADTADTEEWEKSFFEIFPPNGKDGLNPQIGRLGSLNVTTNDCAKNSVSPLLVANAVSKTGPHPFFKAPLSYISYLPLERIKHYMADALGYQDFEFKDFCDPDVQKEDWEKEGIDIKFVSTILTEDDPPTLRPASKVINEPGVAEKIKAAGGFKKIVEPLGEDGEKLVKFMARYGINQQLLVDILTIVKKHSENPNPYI